MNPISNDHDAAKFVYQDNPNSQVVNNAVPLKPFWITSPDRSSKAKKDLKKEKKEKKKTTPYDLMSE